MSDDLSKEEWMALRLAEAELIDPATAEWDWRWGQIIDPYGDISDFPKEWECVGRIYFARRPGSDIWVCFWDLPSEVSDALHDRRRREPEDDDLPF